MVFIKLYYFSFILILFIGCSSFIKKDPTKPSVPHHLSLNDSLIRSHSIKNVEYDISLSLEDKEALFYGTTTVSFSLNDISNDLRLDFIGGKISSMIVNEVAVVPKYNGVFMMISKQNLISGLNKVTVVYTHPYSTDARGLHRFSDAADNRVYLWTQFEPFEANRVFPCFDQPDLKAKYSLVVNAPKSWKVISAEREQKMDSSHSNFNKWFFPKSEVFSTYIFSLHAGEYSVWEDNFKDIPLRLFTRKSLEAYVNPKEWFEPTKNGLNFFPQFFGVKYPYSKYDQIVVPESSFGAMENVGAVTFHERYISRGQKTKEQILDLETIIYHEMAHMWFGNLVTMKWWNDLWLNESFATYMATLAISKIPQKEMAGWIDFNGYKEWAYWEDRLVTTHPIVSDVQSTDQAFSNFDGITYGKGAASLKQLVHLIGEEKFKKGLQNYFRKYAQKNTELKDFIGSLSEATGLDLNSWQKLWLETTGVNSVSASFKCSDDQRLLELNIRQLDENNNNLIRPHKIKLALFNLKSKTGNKPFQVYNVLLDSENQNLKVSPKTPCPNFVYPNYEDFGYVNSTLDPVSLKTLEKHILDFKDKLLIVMLWQDLWRMVIDGKYSLASYSKLVLENIRSISDPVLFKNVLKLKEMYDYFPKKPGIEQQLFAEFSLSTENILLEILSDKKSSPDLKKEAFQILTVAGVSQKAQEHFIYELNLTSNPSKFNLKIDQDMRWLMVQNLTRNGNPKSLELLESEKLRDSSAKGIKEYHTAQASYPDWNSKQKWILELKKSNSEYSLDILKSVANNILPESQKNLRIKYSKDYFKDLDSLLKTSNSMKSANFVYLAPNFCEQEEPDLITGFLQKSKNLEALVSKRLKIMRQESQRCTKIREVIRSHLQIQM